VCDGGRKKELTWCTQRKKSAISLKAGKKWGTEGKKTKRRFRKKKTRKQSKDPKGTKPGETKDVIDKLNVPGSEQGGGLYKKKKK